MSRLDHKNAVQHQKVRTKEHGKKSIEKCQKGDFFYVWKTRSKKGKNNQIAPVEMNGVSHVLKMRGLSRGDVTNKK